jgi:hypothetical protein
MGSKLAAVKKPLHKQWLTADNNGDSERLINNEGSSELFK